MSLCGTGFTLTKFETGQKLKTFTDDKINMTEKFKFVLGGVENIVGKGENAGYQHILLFLQMFSKSFSYWVVNQLQNNAAF